MNEETTAATEVTETIPVTVAETVAETVPVATETMENITPVTEPIVIIEETEVVETYDYVTTLVQIEKNTALTAEASGLIAGFSLFNVVVILCVFVYKFFRIFF